MANPYPSCPAGQALDYDPATGQYLPFCVDQTEAYDYGTAPPPPVYIATMPNPNIKRTFLEQLKYDLGVTGTTLGVAAAIIGGVVALSMMKK